MSTRQLKLQATSFQFMCKHIIVNICYISRRMGATKALDSKSDFQGHWCFLPFHRPHNFLLVFHCGCDSAFYCYQDIIIIIHTNNNNIPIYNAPVLWILRYENMKMSSDPEHISIRGNLSCALEIIIITLHTKFDPFERHLGPKI